MSGISTVITRMLGRLRPDVARQRTTVEALTHGHSWTGQLRASGCENVLYCTCDDDLLSRTNDNTPSRIRMRDSSVLQIRTSYTTLMGPELSGR